MLSPRITREFCLVERTGEQFVTRRGIRPCELLAGGSPLLMTVVAINALAFFTLFERPNPASPSAILAPEDCQEPSVSCTEIAYNLGLETQPAPILP